MVAEKENPLPRGASERLVVRSAIVCQIGAREHYGVACALHRRGQLDELITDIWVRPGSVASWLRIATARKLRDRYHPDLSDANVTHFTANALARAGASSLLQPKNGWDGIIKTNIWFQARAARRVDEILGSTARSQQPVVIAYSYAALRILEAARRHGARTVLCQIDGGEADARLVDSIAARKGTDQPNNPPSSYWANWYRECEIADRIVVNSDWSRGLLLDSAVPAEKICVAPVIYRHKLLSWTTARETPKVFNKARPLKVLFLGALTMRKGIDEVMAAASALIKEPIEFHLVGADREGRGDAAWASPNIKRHDHVPRSDVGRHYREADVFLFPTHSDGFGIVQLEAMSEGLPVIASRNCAVLVEHEVSGIVLQDVSGGAIVQALLCCLKDPARLARMGVAARAAFAHYADADIRQHLEKYLDASNTI